MNKLMDILKGILIGISNIIPGFSGGTMAVILHIYDRLINGINMIFKHPLKAIKDLWALIIGLVIGLVIAVLLISFLLTKFPFPTTMLFVGLIIGSIPDILKETKTGFKKPLNYLWLIIAFIVIVAMPFLNLNEASGEVNLGVLIICLIMGVITASTMVIPGVSGSLTLMALGYYTFILTNLKDLMSGIVHFDFLGMKNPLLITLFFGLGALLGIVLISRLISFLLSKSRTTVFFVIFGLLIGSPFAIIYCLFTSEEYNINVNSVGMWVCAVVLTIVGALLPTVMNKFASKPKEEISTLEN